MGVPISWIPKKETSNEQNSKRSGSRTKNGSRTRTRIKKKPILKQISFLGYTYKIELSIINLNQLISGKSFTILYQITRNRYGIILKIFINFKINNLIFINTPCVIKTVKFFNIIIIHLKNPYPIHEYNKEPGVIITHIIILHLIINERRQLNIPILILDLG